MGVLKMAVLEGDCEDSVSDSAKSCNSGSVIGILKFHFIFAQKYRNTINALMFQVQFCKFKGVRNWSCCLVLELLSLWTSWRCFWDPTICCCSLLSINMNCPPPARTASKLSGTKEFEKMVNSPGILDYTQHMMPHEIQSLGLPSLKPRLPGPLEHNFLRPIKVQGPQLTGTS